MYRKSQFKKPHAPSVPAAMRGTQRGQASALSLFLHAFFGVLLALFSLSSFAQVCAPANLLLTAAPAATINDYYAGSGTPNLLAGASSVVLGPRDTRGYTTALGVGDLLMVMQMQDGSINPANSSSYGDGSGSGRGATSTGRAGLYEFVRVTAVAGANVSFTPPLTNAYSHADAALGSSQKRYQVVRVLQFSSVTAAGLTVPAWNGTTGGVFAMDVRDTLTLGGLTTEGVPNRAVFVAGKGFRGGRGVVLAGNTSRETDYATDSTNAFHASKGEGFIGTPRQTVVNTNAWGSKTTNPPLFTDVTGATEGYPGGSYSRGAPGNAGGGGVDGASPSQNNDKNAGGGGGGNYGPGGVGGRPWSRPLLDTGGRGGAGYAGTLAFNRIFLGGGGGAGSSNNGTADPASWTNNGIACAAAGGRCSSGAAGGGIVVIRARQITGSGVIDARGAHAFNVLNDGAGGGGAGGSVVLHTASGGAATVDVSGGDGGNALAGDNNWPDGRHGPGGSGGGGFVAYAPSAMSVAASVNGGAPGETEANSTAAGKPVPEYYGSSGFNGGINTFQAPNVPGVPPASQCEPNLSLSKSNGVTALTSPGSASYTFTVSNSGNQASFGTITLADRLPPGLTVTPGPLTLGGANAASFNCVAANSTDITCTSAVAVQPNGGTRSFVIATTVNGTNGLSVVNKAIVSGGGDPNKSTTATVALADACSANNTPAGCAIDSDTIAAPSLSLTKTDGTTTVVRGGTVVYSLTVTNVGGSATVGSVTVADVLPSGLGFSGASPFTAGGFTCSVSGQGITCVRPSAIAVSASALITFTAVVGANAPTSVVNLARVGGGGDPSPQKSVAPTTATAAVCPAPSAPADTASDPNTGCAADSNQVRFVTLELTKDDGQAFASQGGSTDYLFTVRNIGTAATAGQINFGDVLPGTFMTFASTGAFVPPGPNGANWSCNSATASTTFCVSSVPIATGASSSFILRANIGNAPAGQQQFNKARVGGGGDVSVGSFNSPTVATIQACDANGDGPGCAVDLNTVQASAQIRLTKSHPAPLVRSINSSFPFTLTVRNSGGTAAGTGTVYVLDVVPQGLVIGTVTPSTPFACSPTVGQVISCANTLGPLAPGASGSIAVAVTVVSTATNAIVNQAKVGTTGSDPQNATTPTVAQVQSCVATDSPLVGCAVDPVPLAADLQITKEQRLGRTGPFQTALLGVAIGDVVQYRLTVSNAAGSAGASTVTFSDPVPFQINTPLVVSTTPAGGATGCVSSFSGTQLSGTVTLLPAGGSCTTLIEGTATTSTVGATNTAVVRVPAGIDDSTPANNTATVVTAIGVANLSLAKTNGQGSVAAGTQTTYTLTVANAGPSPANGTRIFDPVAAGLSCTAAPGCVASGAASCPAGLTMAQLQNTTAPAGVAIPTLGAGSSVAITIACGVTASGQ